MARLAQAGYGSFDPSDLVKTANLVGMPLTITGMEVVTTKFGESIIVHAIEMETGETVKFFMGETKGRMKLVDFFAQHATETVGPLRIEKQGQYYLFVDADQAPGQMPLPVEEAEPDSVPEGNEIPF